MTLYNNLSNLTNLYDKSLQWILNSFDVTKTHTILIYYIFRSPRPFFMFVYLYMCIYIFLMFVRGPYVRLVFFT